MEVKAVISLSYFYLKYWIYFFLLPFQSKLSYSSQDRIQKLSEKGTKNRKQEKDFDFLLLLYLTVR